MPLSNDTGHIDRAKLATVVAEWVEAFFKVNLVGLSGSVLNSGLNQEKEGEVPDPLHQKYALQPGIIDIDHLELVALTSGSQWVPHFRLITPSVKSCVYIPQRRYGGGVDGGFLHKPGLVSFFREDGSYIPVIAAEAGNYAGLVDCNLPALGDAGFTICLRFEVSRSYHLRRHPGTH